MTLAPSWNDRGSKAEVTWPAPETAEAAAEVEPRRTEVATALNWVWFQVLKLSARSSKCNRSPAVKVLNRARFQLSRPGPRSALCPKFPRVGTVVPGTYSAENTDGSNHCITFKLLLGEITESFGYLIAPLRSGRTEQPDTMEHAVVPV